MTELTNDQRLEAEKAICTKLVEMLLEAGYELTLNDGGATPVVRSTDLGSITGAMRTVEDEVLTAYRPDGKRVGSIWLVYGNAPEEVLNDHSVSLDHVMDRHTEWVDRFVEAGYRDPDAPAEPEMTAAPAEPTREQKLEALAWAHVAMMEDDGDSVPITDPEHYWHQEWVEARTILDGVSPLQPRSFTVELRRDFVSMAQVTVMADDEEHAERLARERATALPELWGEPQAKSAYVSADSVRVNRDDGSCPVPAR